MEKGLNSIIGIIVVIIGAGLIFAGFGIILFLIKLALGIAVIYIGYRLITGTFEGQVRANKRQILFGEKHLKIDGDQDIMITVFFARGHIDLSSMDLADIKTNVRVNVLFGSADLTLQSSQPCKIMSNALFGQTSLPNGHSTFIGPLEYRNDIYDSRHSYLDIHLDTVFGHLAVKES